MVAVILAGCGGAAQPEGGVVSVTGSGFRFAAPAGWRVETAGARATARRGSELVQVVTFRLVRPYRAALFGRVAAELSARVAAVAAQTGGRVSSQSIVRAGGGRAHAYEVTAGDRVDLYTFVLRGRREYQLLCRRTSSGSDDACRMLLRSFATT